MSDPVIRIEGLGKRYVIGHQRSERPGMRHVMEDAMRAPLTWFRKRAENKSRLREEFWALKDISFEIKQGEVVGVIGRNGAGKSTLLKILSRITEPTEGRIEIEGRVASLLEVGTGFHQELTGRENIFLNGAILGMSRLEIKRKFDEIVAFSEIEKFLDTPVKRYSSGMYVRLAFAVAAHLEPEILIVDEVLAVGDIQFQKKCLGKMESVARTGRTVIFVSHNIGAITQLCSRAILLESGSLVDSGDAAKVANRYLNEATNRQTAKCWPDDLRAPGNESVRLKSVRVVVADRSTLLDGVDVRDPVGVEVEYTVYKSGVVFVPSLHLHNAEGVQIFVSIDLEADWVRTRRQCGTYTSVAWLPGNFLNIGTHYVSIACSRLDTHELHLFEQQVVAFNVVEVDAADTARGEFSGTLPGAIRPILEWRTKMVSVLSDVEVAAPV
jgi:lipopolysaccharide transport system ATP-binding protein